MNKYGIENFIVEELCECDNEELSSYEIQYIEKYNTYSKGYNATKGGDGRYTYDVDDTNLFSADFIDAFAHLLAFNICIQLTGNSGLQQTQYQLAQQALMRAKYTTASEKHSIPDYPTKYFDGRA